MKNDFVIPQTQEQEYFNKIEILKWNVKSTTERLQNQLLEIESLKKINKEIYEFEQKMLVLKDKKQAIIDDFKTKNFKEYETIKDQKETIEIHKWWIKDIALENKKDGKETEVYTEKKVKIAIWFKPVFTKVKASRKGKNN